MPEATQSNYGNGANIMAKQPANSIAEGATSALLKVVRRLRVSGPDSASTEFEMRQPHLLIGAAPNCDVCLEHPDVSQHHAYLQVILGQIACVDLCSRTGTRWDGHQKSMDWLTLGRRFHVGPYAVELIDDGRGNQDAPGDFPLDCDALEPGQEAPGLLPRVELEWLNADFSKPSKRVKRLITLVGRDPGCQLRLLDPSVSRVHCSLILTKRRFWIVDLLSRKGTLINGEPINCTTPAQGDVLQIGDFRMKIRMREWPHAAELSSIKTAAPPAARKKASPIRRSSSNGGQPESAPSSGAGRQLKVDTTPRTVQGFGRVFNVKQQGTTLLVSPAYDHFGQDYSDLQEEMHLLERQLDGSRATNVIFDLGGVEYAGSEVIGIIVHISKWACDKGGRAALCNADYKMHRVLATMQLFDLWPYFESLQEAFSAIGTGDSDHVLEEDEHVLTESDTDVGLISRTGSAISQEWLGTLFFVERHDKSLVIAPLVKGGMFEYSRLHLESNALLRKLDDPEVGTLVLDLGRVDYSGSELIGVIVKLARKMGDRGGQVYLCRVSASMHDVLRKMRLHKLWPIVDSPEDALR